MLKRKFQKEVIRMTYTITLMEYTCEVGLNYEIQTS